MSQSSKRQIIAMGGGGFSEEPDNPLLDLYVLQQSTASHPKVCFLPTASGDSDGYAVSFYQAFGRYNCKASHLSFFRPHTADIEDFICSQDIIYVGGGNTKSMLAIWREWGMDQILRKAYQHGVILSGLSAGAICWFGQGATDSVFKKVSAISALGILEGSFCPHFEAAPLRQEAFPRMIKTGEMKPGYAVDNCAALHFKNEELDKIVCSVKGRQVQYFNSDGTIQKLTATYLGNN